MSQMTWDPAKIRVTHRDPYLDLLRVIAVTLAVADHWLGAKLWINDARIGANNILPNVPELSPATWVFVADPVLFFVGGAANAHLWFSVAPACRRWKPFFISRMLRIFAPVAGLLVAWLLIEALLHLARTGGHHLIRGVSGAGTGPFGPLWFVLVYLLVIALTPCMLRAHHRFGLRVLILLIICAATVDILRFCAQVPDAGLINILLVWLIPHQLGFFYADRRLDDHRIVLVGGGLLAAGMGGLVVLPCFTNYPVSIQGVPGAAISNMNPPTLYVVAQTLAQVGAVFLLRPSVRRMARLRTRLKILASANRGIMTVYLWHMTALLAAGLLCRPLGFPVGGYSIARSSTLDPWTVNHPIWLLTATGTLTLLVRGFRRFEGLGLQLARGHLRRVTGDHKVGSEHSNLTP